MGVTPYEKCTTTKERLGPMDATFAEPQVVDSTIGVTAEEIIFRPNDRSATITFLVHHSNGATEPLVVTKNNAERYQALLDATALPEALMKLIAFCASEGDIPALADPQQP